MRATRADKPPMAPFLSFLVTHLSRFDTVLEKTLRRMLRSEKGRPPAEDPRKTGKISTEYLPREDFPLKSNIDITSFVETTYVPLVPARSRAIREFSRKVLDML